MNTAPATERPSPGQPATLDRLLPGDLIRLSRDGHDLRVMALSTPVADHSLINLHTALLPHPLTMSPGTGCHLVSAPRVMLLPCLLCQDRSPYAYDAADDGVPRTGICGRCDERTTAAVAGMVGEAFGPGRRTT